MNLAKPLMIGLGALLVGKMLGGASAATQPSASPASGTGAAPPNGGLLGGVGGLVEKLQNAGHGDIVNSWVGSGANKAIDADQLGAALGQKTVSAAAQQAGLNEQQLLAQLSQNLPQIIDQMTPNGKIPSLREIAAALARKQ